MATTILPLQKRSIVVLGKTGAGKSTVANKIGGFPSFIVRSSSHPTFRSVTYQYTHAIVELIDQKTNTKFNCKLIDTNGVFDTERRNDDVMKEIKTYFEEKVPEGVNLVLFIFKKGQFTAEEKETFDYMIKNFRPHISDISALIITNCENEDKNGRREVIDDFKRNASDIAAFMGKGIYAVGFPDTRNMVPALKETYEDLMEADVKDLRELVMKTGDVRLAKEMFEMSFLEKLTQCVLL